MLSYRRLVAQSRNIEKAHIIDVGFDLCSPDGIRTHATALRGRRPRPLDDGALRELVHDATWRVAARNQPPRP